MIFGDDRLIWLEVGFGGGEYMVYMVVIYCDIGIIGCELFINGVVMLLGKICVVGVENVSVYFGDVCDLMDVFFVVSIDKVFLNYFDLWFKVCYYCCCFVMFEYLILLVWIMKLGVEFCVVLDIFDYICQMFEEVLFVGFDLVYEGLDVFQDWLFMCYE